MTKTNRRANTSELDRLHRLTTLAIVAELERLRRAKESVPAALLTASIKLLSVTGSTAPDLPANRQDRLKGLLDEYIATDAEGRWPAGRGSRGPRDVDFTLPEG